MFVIFSLPQSYFLIIGVITKFGNTHCEYEYLTKSSIVIFIVRSKNACFDENCSDFVIRFEIIWQLFTVGCTRSLLLLAHNFLLP